MSVSVHQQDVAASAVTASLERAETALLALRREDERWLSRVDGGVSPAVDQLLLGAWLRKRGAGSGSNAHLAESILSQQQNHGGFSAYEGGPFDLDLTVRAYAALRLSAVAKSRPEMVRCLAAIHAAGGLEKTGALARLDLNFAGLCPREACLSVPVEIMFFRPRWLEPLAAWARATVVPLAIIQLLHPVQECPEGFSGTDLSANGNWPVKDGTGWWRWLEKNSPSALRKTALRRAETWLVDRVNGADVVQESFPAIRYTVMALELLGYAPESAVRHRLSDRLDALTGERSVQPYSAPARDTAVALRSLAEAGSAQSEVPGVEWVGPGAGVEESAAVLLALKPLGGAPNAAILEAIGRLTAAQSEDGGWPSFERSGGRSATANLAGIDPRRLVDCTSPGTTGLALEAICGHGGNGVESAVRRGVEYLVTNQNLDGSWMGQWPGSYIGSTGFAVAGLTAAGEDPHEAHVLRAGEWLRSVQNADGGWGEDPAGFYREDYVPAESTAVQSAMALIGLIESGDHSSDSARRGAAYLVETQGTNGVWTTRGQSGTWQAGAMQTLSELDCLCYPLLALARYRKAQSERGGDNL